MRGHIPTRRALLDIGAAGPLAGLAFAIPLYAWGAAHSRVVAAGGDGTMQLGESILLKLMDRSFAPAVPEGSDLLLSPVAFGAWGGMFVTMINLLPVGQLDGGHVAYALLGTKQDRYAQIVHRALLAFFFVVVVGHTMRDVHAGVGLYYIGRHLSNAIFWIFWFQMLAVLGVLSARSRGDEPEGSISIRTRVLSTVGLLVIASLARDHHSPLLPLAFFAGLGIMLAMERRGGVLRPHALLDHPPTGAAPLDGRRRAVAVVTLILFVLLFMPEPISM
jgi:Zn-dependent protease